MHKIDFVAIHRRARFDIVDGPLKGKSCFVHEINFQDKTITTPSGTIIEADFVAPVLREISDMGDVEAQLMYRTYWGKDPEEEEVEVPEYPWEKPKKKKPVKSSMMRIFQGKDYIAGDWDELMSLVPYLIDCDFDFLDGAKKGWAIIKNRY